MKPAQAERPPFSDWLAQQLKAQRMSHGQLAHLSGVDKSTISRLVRGERTPSLGTATKLSRGLRTRWDEAETLNDPGLPTPFPNRHPTARVEHALRSDELLNEMQVQQVMQRYLALRSGQHDSPRGGDTTADEAGRPGEHHRSPATLRRVGSGRP